MNDEPPTQVQYLEPSYAGDLAKRPPGLRRRVPGSAPAQGQPQARQTAELEKVRGVGPLPGRAVNDSAGAAAAAGRHPLYPYTGVNIILIHSSHAEAILGERSPLS